jgi:general secretion pathway protein C
VWSVHDLIAPPPATTIADARPLAPRADPAAAAERLAATQAFGVLDAAADDREAPDSRLALKLRGVIAAGEPRYSRAFIAGSDDDEHGYPIGAQLPGGAIVQSIHPDRVVLSRNGSLETLRLPREAVASSEAPAFQAADLRSAQANPSRLLDWMRPVVATESNSGRQLGYRVYPGRDPDRFTKLGLFPGDLVTAVNGQPLDDPSRSMELMRNLSGSDNITLTIERDGAQRIVQIPVLQ